MVTGTTRSWQDQRDSILDHIWTNSRDRVANYFNERRAISDHNVIGVNFNLRKIKIGGQTIRKRQWKIFDKEKYLDKIRNTDFTDLYEMTNAELANSHLEDLIVSILDSVAPMSNVQVRTKYLKWLRPETKQLMEERDLARNKARLTQLANDWDTYRTCRNKCTKEQR